MIPLGVLAASGPAPTDPPVDTPVPVLSWAFDEGSGSTFAPTHGAAIGQLLGSWVAGVHGYGILAAGYGDDAAEGSPLFDASGWAGITISAWALLPDASGEYHFPWSLRHGWDEPLLSLLLTTHGLSGYYIGGTFYSDSTLDYVPDVWRHYALSFDGSRVQVWLNGTLAVTRTLPGGMVSQATQLSVGSDYYGFGAACAVDDLRVHDVVLTSDQIRHLMTQGV